MHAESSFASDAQLAPKFLRQQELLPSFPFLLETHQLLIGETTCSSVFNVNEPKPNKEQMGVPWFTTDEMSRIALERCKTARCAVKLMGELAED